MTCQGGLGEPLPGPGAWIGREWGAVTECGGKMRLREEEKPQLLHTHNFSPCHKCKRTEVLPGELGAGNRGRTQP